jgi:hypothetical protein
MYRYTYAVVWRNNRFCDDPTRVRPARKIGVCCQKSNSSPARETNEDQVVLIGKSHKGHGKERL